MILLGNIVALIASCFMVYAGALKKKSKILLFQSVELFLYTVSNIILGGISGAIINFLGMIANILGYKNKLNNLFKILFSVIAIILTILFNNLGLVGYFPLVCIVIYLWIIDIKNIYLFKYLLLIDMIFWGIYDFFIKSYVATLFDVFTIISIIISLIRLKKGKKKSKRQKK